MRNLYILITLFAASLASAQLIDWVDWTSATVGSPGSAEGLFSSGITVSYTGEVASPTQTGTGTNFWTEFDPAPYTGNSVIGNAPTPAEMIALNSPGIRNTITFSKEVLNPVMALVSVGQDDRPVTYSFDQSFNFLSQGVGYWNDFTGVPSSYTMPDSNTLVGTEFHGAIQFLGSFTEISWTTDPGEFWHGFTVGAPVPEPGAIGLIMAPLGIGLILFIRRRRRQ